MIGHWLNCMKYAKEIYEARKAYKLDGISNHKLIEALEKANGNVDEAILQLLPK